MDWFIYRESRSYTCLPLRKRGSFTSNRRCSSHSGMLVIMSCPCRRPLIVLVLLHGRQAVLLHIFEEVLVAPEMALGVNSVNREGLGTVPNCSNWNPPNLRNQVLLRANVIDSFIWQLSLSIKYKI